MIAAPVTRPEGRSQLDESGEAHARVGDVAVSNSGTYGHVMYVEAVHGDGTITISQYNADWKGNYSEGRRSTRGLTFVHF